MKVLVDIDGVLNEFQSHAVNYIESLGYKYNYAYNSQYLLENGIQDRNCKKIWKGIMTDKNFWLTIPKQNNAYLGLKYLSEKYDTYIATAPFNDRNKSVKKQWIKENFPFFDTKKIIFSKSKWELGGDVIIEDRPETLNACNGNGYITIKREQPYNLNTHAHYTFSEWGSIISIMNKIEGELNA